MPREMPRNVICVLPSKAFCHLSGHKASWQTRVHHFTKVAYVLSPVSQRHGQQPNAHPTELLPHPRDGRGDWHLTGLLGDSSESRLGRPWHLRVTPLLQMAGGGTVTPGVGIRKKNPCLPGQGGRGTRQGPAPGTRLSQPCSKAIVT